MILGYLGDERVDPEGPGWEDDLRCSSSRFLKSGSCSNFFRLKWAVWKEFWAGILSWGILLIGRRMERNWQYLVEVLRWVNCWCPSGTTFGSEDPQVGSSSHLFPQSATRPLTHRS